VPALKFTALAHAANYESGGTVESLLTIDDVAKLLRVPVSWVYDRLRRNAPNPLPGFKLAKYWRFRAAEVLAWLDARHV
jgi:excisionase family DNA binding protein